MTRAGKTNDDAQRYRWLRQLVEWAKINEDDLEGGVTEIGKTPKYGTSNVGEGVFEKEVFVFSPQGQLLALSKGSTVLDYAYQIHSELGNHCVGAKVNGKMVKLNYALQNGETVEILQSASQTPKQEWLQIAQSSKAIQRIRSWLKKEQIGEESLSLGREILENSLKKYASRQRQGPFVKVGTTEFKKYLVHVLSTWDLEDEDMLYRALAFGQIPVKKIAQEIFALSIRNSGDGAVQDDDSVFKSLQEKVATTISTKSTKPDGVVIGGKRTILVTFCRNCNPLYGEEVKGFVTQGRGVKIHTKDCHYLQASDPERQVDAIWDTNAATAKPSRSTRMEVVFEDAPGILAGMSTAITSSGVNIGGVILRTLSNGRGLARFDLMLASIEDLMRVTENLKRVSGVLGVERR
jgi:GTP pyrophosphokinase